MTYSDSGISGTGFPAIAPDSRALQSAGGAPAMYEILRFPMRTSRATRAGAAATRAETLTAHCCRGHAPHVPAASTAGRCCSPVGLSARICLGIMGAGSSNRTSPLLAGDGIGGVLLRTPLGIGCIGIHLAEGHSSERKAPGPGGVARFSPNYL